MAAPLLTHEFDLYARPFSFCDGSSKSLDEGLDVGEWKGRRGRAREDGGERFALLGVHVDMIAKSAITCKQWGGLRRLTFDMSGTQRRYRS